MYFEVKETQSDWVTGPTDTQSGTGTGASLVGTRTRKSLYLPSSGHEHTQQFWQFTALMQLNLSQNVANV